MHFRFLPDLRAITLPPLVRYLVDELLSDDGGVAARLCRYRLARSWPSLSCVLVSRRRSSAAA